MKKIPKHEMPEILPVKSGRSSNLRAGLIGLEIGEGLKMPIEEWKGKKPPYDIVSRIKKKFGYRYKYGLSHDKTEWLFKRVK
ncbi:MAG: hypothetical protein NTY88_02460 [Bacteroidetes bacterium]|nr:hypothetical protein [Bacteroidota bacterium]